MSHHSSVVVIPCSGIGKPFGTVSREAAYELCENLRPGRHRPRCAIEACSWRTRRTVASPQQTGGNDRRLQVDVRVETREAQWWVCRPGSAGTRCFPAIQALETGRHCRAERAWQGTRACDCRRNS